MRQDQEKELCIRRFTTIKKITMALIPITETQSFNYSTTLTISHMAALSLRVSYHPFYHIILLEAKGEQHIT